MVTVFTPTYNRAYLLPRLYDSLCKQICTAFEWLVIDDGSTDGTEALCTAWQAMEHPFKMYYYKVRNGGKQRAINKALGLARGQYFFIVDSDDCLTPDAISVVMTTFESLPANDTSFIGISMVRGDMHGIPLHRIPHIDAAMGYVDCSNLDRPKYDLQADMAEVFYTERLKQYSFPVWKGETFTPEAVVWDRIAMDGYRLRWTSKVTYLCEYQEKGLTKSSWPLLWYNPMGYAMLFNTQLKVNAYRKNRQDSLSQGIDWEIHVVMQFVSCCCLAGEYRYIGKCVSRFVWLLLLPGWLLSWRRRWQLRRYSR